MAYDREPYKDNPNAPVKSVKKVALTDDDDPLADLELSPRQRLFVEEYLITWNATESARRCGYENINRSISHYAQKLLEQPKIQEAVRRRIRGKAMEADEVIARLSAEARGDIGEFFEVVEDEETHEQSIVLDLKGAKEKGMTHLIKSVRYGKHGIEFELYDAQKAKQTLARIYGLTDHRQNETNINVLITSDEMAAARAEIERRKNERALTVDGRGKVVVENE